MDTNLLMGVAAGVAAGAALVGTALYVHAGAKCPAISSSAKVKKTGLKEFSVVYTDRATNLMSSPFQQVMRDISSELKAVYNAKAAVLIPGSGTYAMEAVARQFGSGKKCMILRNGYFSFRWSDILEVTGIAKSETVLKARMTEQDAKPHFAPMPIQEVIESIKQGRPDVFFAPHVETSTGIIISDDYIQQISQAVHDVGGLFVLDAIASGTVWVDMAKLGIDALITAPQKGWSGPACVGIVMLGERGLKAVKSIKSPGGSFCCNMQKWLTVMETYEGGGFMYYTTLPTDALTSFRDAIMETKAHGYEKAKEDLFTLGEKIREVCEKNGFKSVAAEGFKAPGVVVSYSDDKAMVAHFKGQGLQIAGGVPFKIDEPEGLITFRLGLFGLDKIKNINGTVSIFAKSLASIKDKMTK